MKKLINIIATLALVLCAVSPATTAYAAEMPDNTFYADHTQTPDVEPIIGPAVMYLNGALLYADGSETYMLNEDGTRIPVRVVGSHYFFTECNGDEVCIDDANLTLTQPTVETVNGIDVYTDKNGDSFVYDSDGELRAAEKLENGNLAFFDKNHNIVFFMPNGHFCVLGALVDTIDLKKDTSLSTSFSTSQSVDANDSIGYGVSEGMNTSSGYSYSVGQPSTISMSESVSAGTPFSVSENISGSVGHSSGVSISIPATLDVYTDWNGKLYFNDNGIDRPFAEYEGNVSALNILPAPDGYIVSGK